MLLHFVDAAPAVLGKLERTPQGGYIVPATIARVGVMLYAADNLRAQGVKLPDSIAKGGLVRVYTPPDVLSEGAASLKTASVTNEHPRRMVTVDTYRQVSCGGLLSESVHFDGEFLRATLTLQDADLLRAVQRLEKTEVSAGYYSDTEFAPGTTPAGEEYDAIRRGVVYNHVAVVSRGRAGPQVCLALDSMDIPTEEVNVRLRIRGVEMDASTAQAAIDALEGELAGAQARVTTLDSELQAEKTARATETSDAALDARVQAKLDADKLAAERAARLKAVTDAFPKTDLKGRSQDFIDGLFATLETDSVADPDGVERMLGKRGPKVEPKVETPKVNARQAMIAANRAVQKS